MLKMKVNNSVKSLIPAAIFLLLPGCRRSGGSIAGLKCLLVAATSQSSNGKQKRLQKTQGKPPQKAKWKTIIRKFGVPVKGERVRLRQRIKKREKERGRVREKSIHTYH